MSFHEDGVIPLSHLKKPISTIELFRIVLKVLNGKDIIIEDGKAQKVNALKELSFEAEVSQAYFNDASVDLEQLLQAAMRTNDLQAINEFANTIYTLAKKHKLQSVVEFAKELLAKIDSFDIEGIDTMLSEYESKAKSFNHSLSSSNCS